MSRGKIAEAQMTDSHPDQPRDFIPELEEHPANLTVDSLAQDNAKAVGPDRLHLLNARPLSIEHYPAQQFGR